MPGACRERSRAELPGTPAEGEEILLTTILLMCYYVIVKAVLAMSRRGDPAPRRRSLQFFENRISRAGWVLVLQLIN